MHRQLISGCMMILLQSDGCRYFNRNLSSYSLFTNLCGYRNLVVACGSVCLNQKLILIRFVKNHFTSVSTIRTRGYCVRYISYISRGYSLAVSVLPSRNGKRHCLICRISRHCDTCLICRSCKLSLFLRFSLRCLHCRNRQGCIIRGREAQPCNRPRPPCTLL